MMNLPRISDTSISKSWICISLTLTVYSMSYFELSAPTHLKVNFGLIFISTKKNVNCINHELLNFRGKYLSYRVLSVALICSASMPSTVIAGPRRASTSGGIAIFFGLGVSPSSVGELKLQFRCNLFPPFWIKSSNLLNCYILLLWLVWLYLINYYDTT